AGVRREAELQRQPELKVRDHLGERAEAVQFGENSRQRVRLVRVGDRYPRIQALKALRKLVEVRLQASRVDDMQRRSELTSQRGNIATVDLELASVVIARAPLARRDSLGLSEPVTERFIAAVMSPQQSHFHHLFEPCRHPSLVFVDQPANVSGRNRPNPTVCLSERGIPPLPLPNILRSATKAPAVWRRKWSMPLASP